MWHISFKKGGNNSTNIISSIVNRVNLNPVNFGYLSPNDRLKDNDTKGTLEQSPLGVFPFFFARFHTVEYVPTYKAFSL